MNTRQRLIDLAAKWKHGWIPLNAEAEAILAAKADKGVHLSHEQLLAMKLTDVKAHYSATIKAHGFQHAYTKKVGKVVGSHPEALAATKAKKAANQAKAAGVPPPSAPAAPEPPKAPDAPKVEPPKAEPTPGILEKVHSTSGEHIGFLAKGKGEGGKAHMVFDKQGNVVGHVNSFTGAQHVLGETKLGKPPAPKPPHEKYGEKVEYQALQDAPVGAVMAHLAPSGKKRYYTKVEGGNWKNDSGVVLAPGEFQNSITTGKLEWADPKVASLLPHQHVGEKLDATDGLTHMKDAPVGTAITTKSDTGDAWTWVKTDDGWKPADMVDDPMATGLPVATFTAGVHDGNWAWAEPVDVKPKPGIPKKIGDYHVDDVGHGGGWSVHDSETNWIGTVVTSEDGKSFAAMAVDPSSEYGDSEQISTHSTPEAAAKALIKHHAPPEPKAPSVKIEPDPPPPTTPDPKEMAKGWVIHDATQLDEAPIGSWVSLTNDIAFQKVGDEWKRHFKNNGEWMPTVYQGNTSSHHIVNIAKGNGGVYWGQDGPNTTAPEGYTGPRYGLVQGPGETWQVKDYYSGQLMPGTLSSGKPNASKKVNDLNMKAGTLSAAQKKAQIKKAALTQKQNDEFIATSGGVAPHELGHPTVPVGATPEQQLEFKFDASKAGELHAIATAEPTTPNEHLFEGWNGGAAAKKHTAQRISERMAKHYGLEDQEKLDDAWTAAAKANMVNHSGGTIGSFSGTEGDAFNAVPLPDDGGNIKRGTPEFNQLMREKMVAHMIQLWAQSSNDDHAVTLTLQDLAGTMFGVSDQAAWDSASHQTQSKMNDLKGDAAFHHLATSFLQSQYDDTQATLAAKGISHVVVRRGVKSGVSSDLKVGDAGVLKMRPMSSWSTNPQTAQGFSGGKWVLQTKVPREKIIGFAGSGFGCLNEYEVVVIGGRTQARVVRKNNSAA